MEQMYSKLDPEKKRCRGRPKMRWADDLKKHAGTRWRRLGKAYIQGWTEED